MTKEKKPRFEESLKRLEEIVSRMESGELTLEEALANYEEGVRLLKFCTHALDAAEKKIEILGRDERGEVAAAPFNPGGGGEAAEQNESGAKKPRVAAGAAGDEDSGEQFLF